VAPPPAPSKQPPSTNGGAHARSNLWEWLTGRRPAGNDTENPDAMVGLWKTAWAEGANARWRDGASALNPYSGEPARSAWFAGCRWAAQNPDRRSTGPVRMAHRRRRATDSSPYLSRAVGLGVVSLTLFAMTRGLKRWRQSTDKPKP
jgi:hypothetical protein